MNPRIILGVLVLITVGLVGFAGYQVLSSKRSATPTPAVLSLQNYETSDDAVVRFTIEGPIVANENHLSQMITVSKSNRTLQAFRSYSNTPVVTQSFANNQAAFTDFMRALQNANFLKTTSGTPTPSPGGMDELGACPTGNRFVYELISADKTIARSWSTSCGDTTSFNGVGGQIRLLFENQIPNYQTLTHDVRL